MNFFSPFAAIVAAPNARLEPTAVYISCAQLNNKKSLYITLTEQSVIDHLGFEHRTFVRVQGVIRHGVPCMTLRRAKGVGEGKITRYNEYTRIKADALTFLPAELHDKKHVEAFFDPVAKTMLVYLPLDYKPSHVFDQQPHISIEK